MPIQNTVFPARQMSMTVTIVKQQQIEKQTYDANTLGI